MAEQWESQGKNFVITGGASGLGAAHAEAFLKGGAKAIAILDVAENVGKATAERLNNAYPGDVSFIKCDVSQESDIAKAFDEALSKLKQIDVLVNNAGIMVDNAETWRVACDVNWQGLVSFTMRAVNHMSKSDGGAGGTIINISSTAALTKFPYLPIYNGSKIAVLHFAQSLAMPPFYEKTGVRLLTMCFGPTDTALLQGLENRCYKPEVGQAFADFIKTVGVDYQKVDSAVAAFQEMYRTGNPGSIWVSVSNKPGQDITSVVDKVFAELDKYTM